MIELSTTDYRSRTVILVTIIIIVVIILVVSAVVVQAESQLCYKSLNWLKPTIIIIMFIVCCLICVICVSIIINNLCVCVMVHDVRLLRSSPVLMLLHFTLLK